MERTLTPKIPAARLVVIMPNWLGDAVMATPFLRALRAIYPTAHIAAVARPLVAPVLRGDPALVDAIYEQAKDANAVTARWLHSQKFDLGILLPNSFRSAWLLWRGNVKRRLGYARGGRSLLLTDRIMPFKKTEDQRRRDLSIRYAISLLQFDEKIADGELLRVECSARNWFPQPVAIRRTLSTGQIVRVPVEDSQPVTALMAPFQPTPAIDYYLALTHYLSTTPLTSAPFPPASLGLNAAHDHHMILSITPQEREEADAALAQIENRNLKIENLVVIVPGANFGSSKCWPPDRFAAVAQALADPAGPFRATVLLATSPAERPIADAISAALAAHQDRVHILSALNAGRGLSVGALKEIVRRSRLMICNDTGPRHFAAAFDIPTVTLFGPTDPRWAETFSPHEKILRIDVPCGPCQLKKCPIDHRCMQGITIDMVLIAAKELW